MNNNFSLHIAQAYNLIMINIINIIIIHYNIGSKPGVNYRNWVMRAFDLGNWLFFLLVFKQHFIEHKMAHGKRPNCRLINDNCQKNNDYSASFVPF